MVFDFYYIKHLSVLSPTRPSRIRQNPRPLRYGHNARDSKTRFLTHSCRFSFSVLSRVKEGKRLENPLCIKQFIFCETPGLANTRFNEEEMAMANIIVVGGKINKQFHNDMNKRATEGYRPILMSSVVKENSKTKESAIHVTVLMEKP